MSSIPPPNFLDLNTASTRCNADVNIMGVVTDIQAPCRSRGTDWMCSFRIVDSSYGVYDDSLKIRFFKPTQKELPALTGTGDVVLLRSVRINRWSGMTIGLSNRGTTWAVFPAASIPTAMPTSQLQLKHVKEPRAAVPNPSEMQYAVSLCNSHDRSTFSVLNVMPASTFGAGSPSGSPPANSIRRDKFTLIKNAQVETFYDLVAQVVKVYAHNDRVELYVSDYTSNNLLFNYEGDQDDDYTSGREGDEYNYAPRNSVLKKWNGPEGKLTLTITLWPPHADFGRETLKEKDFVHLRNVHIKWSQDKKMEGVLHSDRRYPDRIDVTILRNNEDDDRVKDVLRRKRAHEKKSEDQNTGKVALARALKRKEMDDSAPLSKNQAKKRRKRQGKDQLDNPVGNMDGKENHVRPSIDTSKDQKPPVKSLKQDLTTNVNCSHHLITPRSVSSIISLDNHSNITPNGTPYIVPFHNINSRATVRVVDFFPSDLADFAVPCPKSSEYDILSDVGSNGSDTESALGGQNESSGLDDERGWEWRFGLVLEDAMGPRSEEKATVEVYVAGQDAECLLKLDAEDLCKSPEALATLREKLFLLWGDLEERKSQKTAILEEIDSNSRSPRKEESPKSKPFQCCLKEYGVKKVRERSAEGVESGNDGDSESENTSVQDGLERRSHWVWERRWRLFGCTIV